MNQKVAVIFTGGTIAMAVDSKSGLASPALDGTRLLELAGIAPETVEMQDFGNRPSPHFQIEDLTRLTALIEETAKREDIEGIVVTHGTDTLEESAFFVDCIYGGVKPVIFTGAMRNSSQRNYDGVDNLLAAITAAKSAKTKGLGVLVVFSGEIHAARDVIKTDSSALQAFTSPGKGPLGIVDRSEVFMWRSLNRRLTVKPKKVNAKVALVKTTIGMDADCIQYCIRNNYQGIVVEAMGRGNVPPVVAKKIEEALNLNLIVVITTRCVTGRVAAEYDYAGSANDLQEKGAILAGDMTSEKARLRLMTALSSGLAPVVIAAIFKEDIS